jgi:hypothetical protein
VEKAMPAQFKTALTPSLLALTAARGLATTGCSTIDQAKDLEMARGEARYVPVELIGTLALGVMRASDYGTYSSVVHQSYSSGDPITSYGCASVALVDGMGQDGEGTVFYDFQPCPERSGQVQVTQRVTSDLLDEERDENFPGDGWEDTDGDGIPDGLPPGSDDVDLDGLTPEELSDLLGGSADIEVAYQGYQEGLLSMDGSLSMSASVDGTSSVGGPLAAELAVEAWNYGGVADIEGSWKFGMAEDSRRLSFTGEFESATGLPWTVMANNVELSAGCLDATAGEITAVFGNGLGEVTVTARFDTVCDGCASIFIDGEAAGRVCLPEEVQMS